MIPNASAPSSSPGSLPLSTPPLLGPAPPHLPTTVSHGLEQAIVKARQSLS